MGKTLRSFSRPSTRDRFQFKFYFHAKQIPISVWDKLVVSLVSFETGRPIAKTAKVHALNGTCQWPDPVIESTRITQDPVTRKYDEKLYKLVVATGSLQSGVLGDTTINLAEFVNSKNPGNVALPLKNCNGGIVLFVRIQCIKPRARPRDPEHERHSKASHDAISNEETGGVALPKNLMTGSVESLASQQWTNTSSSVHTKDGASSLDYSSDSSDSVTHTSRAGNGHGNSLVGDGLSPHRSTSRAGNGHGNKLAGDGLSPHRSTSRAGNGHGNSLAGDGLSPHHSTSRAGNGHGSSLVGDGLSPHRSTTSFPCWQDSVGTHDGGKVSRPGSGQNSNLGQSQEGLDCIHLEAAKATIQELRAESITWQRCAQKLKLEVETSNKQLADERRNGANIEMEISVLEAERDIVKLEVEQLKAAKLASQERESGDDYARWLAEDTKHTIKELQEEITHEKDVNLNLNLQLGKIQDSNMELVSAVAELEETLELQDREIRTLTEENSKLKASMVGKGFESGHLPVHYEEKWRKRFLAKESEWRQKLADKDEEVKRMQSEITGLHSEVKHSNVEESEWRSKLTALETEWIQKLMVKDEEIKNFMAEVSRLDTTLSMMRVTNHGARPEEDLNRTAEIFKRGIVEPDKDRQELTDENSFIFHKLDRANGELEAKTRSFMDLERRLETLLGSNVRSNKSRAPTIQIEKNEYGEKLEAEHKESIIVKERLSSMTEQLATLTSTLNSQLATRRDLEKRTSELENQKEDLESIITDLEQENLELSERTSGLQAQLRHVTGEAGSRKLKEEDLHAYTLDLQAEKSRLEAAFQKTITEQQQKISQLDHKLAHTLKDAENHNQVRQRLERELEQLRDEISKLNQSKRELEGLVVSQESSRSLFEQQLQEALQDRTSFAAMITSLEGEVDCLRRDADQREKDLQVEIESLILLKLEHGRLAGKAEKSVRRTQMEKAGTIDCLHQLAEELSSALIEKEKLAAQALKEASELRAEKLGLEDSHTHLQEKCRLVEESAALKEKLEAMIKDMTAELGASKKQLKEMEDRLHDAYTSLERVKIVENNDKMKIQELEKRLAESISEKQKAFKETIVLSNQAAELTKMRKELEDTRSRLAEVMISKEERGRQADKAEETVKGIQLEKTSAVDCLQSKLLQLADQLSSTLDEKERMASEALVEASDLRAQKLELKDSHRQMQEKCRHTELAAISQKERFEAKMKEMTAELATLKKQQRETEERFHDANKNLDWMKVVEAGDKMKVQELERRLMEAISDKSGTFEDTLLLNNKGTEFIRMKTELENMRVRLKDATTLKEEHERRADIAEEMIRRNQIEKSTAGYSLQNKLLQLADQLSSTLGDKEKIISEALVEASELRAEKSELEDSHRQMQEKCRQAEEIASSLKIKLGTKIKDMTAELDATKKQQKDTEVRLHEAYKNLERMKNIQTGDKLKVQEFERRLMDTLCEKQRVSEENIILSNQATLLVETRTELENMTSRLEELIALKEDYERRAVKAEESVKKSQLEKATAVESLQNRLHQIGEQLSSTLNEKEKLASVVLAEASELRAKNLELEDSHRQMQDKCRQTEDLSACLKEKYGSKIEDMTAELGASKKQQKDTEQRLHDAYKSLERLKLTELEDRLKIQELKGSLTEAMCEKQRILEENVVLSNQAVEFIRSKTELEDMKSRLEAVMILKEEHEKRADEAEESVRRTQLEKVKAVNYWQHMVQQLTEQLSSSVNEKERIASQALVETSEVQAEKLALENSLRKMQENFRQAEVAAAAFIDQLEAKIKGMTAELHTSKQQQKDIEEKLYDACKNLEQRKIKFEELEKSHTDALREKQRIFEENIILNNQTTELIRIQTELKTMRSRLEEIMVSKEEHERRADKAEKTVRRTQLEKASAVESLQNKLHQLAEQFSTTLDEREKIVSEALVEASELRAEMFKLENSLSQMQEKCRQSEEEASSLKEKLGTKTKEMTTQLDASKKQQKDKQERLHDAYKHLERTEGDNKLRIQELERMLTEAKSERQRISEENLVLSNQTTELIRIKAELEDMLGRLEQEDTELKEELEMRKTDFAKREVELCNKIKLFEMSNEKVADSGAEQLRAELIRLQKQIASLSRREQELSSKLSVMEVVQSEVQQLQEVNEELETYLSKLMENVENPNILKKVVALETELAEAIEAKDMYKLQLKSIFEVQQNVNKSPLHKLGDADQVNKEFSALKNHVVQLEAELGEMREQYTVTSLQLAEMEAERGELLLTIRTLRNITKPRR